MGVTVDPEGGAAACRGEHDARPDEPTTFLLAYFALRERLALWPHRCRLPERSNERHCRPLLFERVLLTPAGRGSRRAAIAGADVRRKIGRYWGWNCGSARGWSKVWVDGTRGGDVDEWRLRGTGLGAALRVGKDGVLSIGLVDIELGEQEKADERVEQGHC